MALNKKFEMKSALEKLLDSKVILTIPSCIFTEVQSLESKIPGLLKLLSQYKIQQCPHGLLSPTNCIRDYIGNKNQSKYFVATQDNFLRMQLRNIPGVPLIFFEQNMLLMDKPSRVSIEASERRENLKEDPQKKEKKILGEKKEEIKDFLIQEFKESKYYKRKQEEFKLNKLMGNIRKKAKGPNPLSVKKKNSYYIQKEKDIEYKKKMMEFNNTINLKEDEENEFQKENNSEDGKIKKIENINNYNNNNFNDGSNNNFIKKKRKRKHKK
jgi:U3 small nucleolar RNA-associated protein 23